MFEQAEKLIKESNTIYITAHKNPDGDAIGGDIALYLALKKLNKNVNFLISSYADSFNFLTEINQSVKSVDKSSYDLLIAIDSSDKSRLDINEDDFKKAKKVLMLDHHKMSAPYGDVNCIDEDSPAVCQIIYEFLIKMNIDIDIDIAKYIYIGIMTDTGSFNYSSTTAQTLEIASKLVATGIDFSYICNKLNHTIKEAKLKLIAKTIEKMEVYFDGQVRYSFIDYNTIADLGLSDEDAEGMTNYLQMPEGTRVAVYIRQKKDGTYKVSMRSDDKVNVGQIAIEFGGGGHKRAAGYDIIEKLDIEKKKLLEALEENLKGDVIE